MKKRFLLLLPILLVGVIAFVISCVRNRDTYWDSSDLRSKRPLAVSDAKKWFENEFDDEISVARDIEKEKSVRMVSYAEGVFAGIPEWLETRPFRRNSNSLISTLDYLDPKSRYKGFRDVVIVRNNRTKSFNAFVQLELFDTSYLNSQKSIKGELANIREYSDPATFTGKVYKYSMDNEFIRGAVYKNGKLVARVFPKNKLGSFFNSVSSAKAKQSYVPFNGGADLSKSSSTNVSKTVTLQPRAATRSYEEGPVKMAYGNGDSTDTEEYDTNDPDSNMQTVVVSAPGSDTDTCDPLWGDTCDGSGTGGNGDPYPTDPCSCGGGGSTGGTTTPPTSTPPDPCAEIKKHTAAYNQKTSELKGNTKLRHETGFEETKTGTFNTLSPSQSTSNSDGLKINVTAATKGFTHTHQDDYETTEGSSTDEVIIRQPIKMFSPRDVSTLLEIVKQNKDSTDFSPYYVSMVTSSGQYELRFTGTSGNVQTGFGGPAWNERYKNFMQRYTNIEKGFLKFLREEMNVGGVSLYKINRDGSADQKQLSSNNRSVTTTPCPR